MRRSTVKLVLAYGALAAAVLACLHILSLAPLVLDWGREFAAAAIAVVALLVGLRLAERREQRRAAHDAPAPTSAAEPAAVPEPSPTPEAGALSARQREILALLAAGLSNKEIARELVVSENTIKTHLANLYAKLGVGRRTEALAVARRQGLIG